MSNQPTPKLTFNGKNFRIGIFLILVLHIVGPLAGVDPTLEAGKMFYFFGAILTAFMFPWLTMETKDESKDQKTDS